MFVQLGVIARARNKFVEIAATSDYYLVINSAIKDAIVPNMPSSKIHSWKNVNIKREKAPLPNLQYCQFGQDG